MLWPCYDMVTYVQGVIVLRPGCGHCNVRTGQQGTGERTTGPSANASLDLMLFCWRENICLLLINIAFLSHVFFCCANCVCVSLSPPFPLSLAFSSPPLLSIRLLSAGERPPGKLSLSPGSHYLTYWRIWIIIPLGPHGSLLSSVLLSPHICTFVKS